MRALLDGDWATAKALVAEIRTVAGHDGNFALGCQAQSAWLHRETGRTEQEYQSSLQLVEMLPDFPVLRALLVADAAEAGHLEIAAGLLDELAPDDFAAVGRGWLTVLALGNVAWAAIAVDARRHAPVLRTLLAEFEGTMAVIASGTHVMCSIDRLLAGLAALDGDHAEADRLFAAALAQEECGRHRSRRALVTGGRGHWFDAATPRQPCP